jgi:hypothetical protein
MNWEPDFLPFQQDFFESNARFPAMVSAWGTGKTMTAIAKAMKLSLDYPNNLGVIFRKNYTDLKDSTMKDFTLYTDYRVPSSKDVTLHNGSTIYFRHLEEIAGITQNVNLGWFFIEQAEEFESEEVFIKLRGRLRRHGVPHQGFIIANTNGHNWIWRMWKQGEDVEYPLTEAKTYDNPHLPQDFIDDLTKMKEDSPNHYRRFVMNSWEDTDLGDQVIAYDKILGAVDRDLRDYDGDKVIISSDPAELGGDKSVIYVFKGFGVIDYKILSKRSTMETAGWIQDFYKKYHASKIVVDADGVGVGVRDILRERNFPVTGIKNASRPNDKLAYRRLRDEIWFKAAEVFSEDRVSIPDDKYLVEDLAIFTYSMNSQAQRVVARKKDIKKLLNRSPDRADALVYGLWEAAKTLRHRTRVEPVLVGAKQENNYDPFDYL